MADITETTTPVENFQSVAGGPGTAGAFSGDNPTPGMTDAPGAPSNAVIAALAKAAAVNGAEVQFPPDPWGFTVELRKAGLKAASNVRGNADKNTILIGTLMVLIGHVRNRLHSDQEALAAEIAATTAALDEAEKFTRQHARPYNPEDSVRAAMATIAAARESGQFADIVGTTVA